MPIITGGDSEFGRLVAEEFRRRAQRVVDLGQAAPDTEVDETLLATTATTVTMDSHNDTEP